MHIPEFFRQMRTLIAMAVIGVVAGTGVGLGFAALQADDDGEDRVAFVTAEECGGFGQADFFGVESMDHLLSRADVVAKVRVTDRSNTYDTYAAGRAFPTMRHIYYTMDVLEVLVGEEPRESVTLALSFGEVCLDPGDDEYYMFMYRDREPGEPYVEDPHRAQLPGDYGLAWFGPQNVWAADSGIVRAMEGYIVPAMERYDGISEDEFRRAVLESAERKAAQSEE